MDKKSNSNTFSIWVSVIEVFVGILLLINPVAFTSSIIVMAGVVLIIIGIEQTVQYFRTDAAEAALRSNLTIGILCILLGLFCTFRSGWFMSTFPVITLIYGVVILITGIGKLQKAIDMSRLKLSYWYVALISAILTLVFAILIISNPFTSTAVLWTFTGVTLIIEAVLDVLAYIFAKKS